MSGSNTLVTSAIIAGDGTTLQTVANQVTIDGTIAEMPVWALWNGGAIAGPGNTLEVTDVLNLTNTGLIVGLLENIGTVLAGDLSVEVPPLDYTISGTGTVGVTSGTLVAAGAAVRSLTIGTLSGSISNIWLNPTGGAAVVNAGLPVWAGGGSVEFGDHGLPMPSGPITAITDGGTIQVVTLAGG